LTHRPNGRAQQDLLHAALKDARLQPSDVCLLETHGTGTKLGDPVEVAALSAVFGPHRDRADPLLLTAVKANVGHLEAGAGMAGLFSILLALQQRTAPPNALLHKLNEEVRAAIGDANMVPIAAATALTVIPGKPLVAGVSSFGYSGTIAHVLLQEPPDGVRRPSLRKAAAQAIPTPTPAAVNASATHSEKAVQHPNAISRAAMVEVAESSDEDDDEESGAGHKDAALDQVWQFAGQGDMRVGAGKELYDTEEAFRSAMTECDRIVLPYLGQTISEMLYPPGCETAAKGAATPKPAAVQAAEALLAQTVNSQVALVALEYCLAAVWLDQGMTPNLVLGHSLGEFALNMRTKW
jgi:acyl transferase domain-containing protein